MIDLVVVGGGPAGRALAAECAARGLATALVDRNPDAPWRATYGAWLDELPDGLPAPAATVEGWVIAATPHPLERTYAVLDVAALRAHLDARLAASGVRVVAGRVVARAGSAVLLADGARLAAHAIVDAGGHYSPLRDAAGRRSEGPVAIDPTDGSGRDRDGHTSSGSAIPRRRAPSGASDNDENSAHRSPVPRGWASPEDSGSSRRASGACLTPRDTAAPDRSGRAGSRVWPDRALRRLTTGREAARERVAAEQTAYGVVVDAATAAPLLGDGEALFMDWRPDHGDAGWPTFLYAVPLGGGEVLLEETSLARRPGVPLPVLRRRLRARLAHHGITPPADARVERVRFPVDRPRHATPGVLGFGAAAPLVHPATGFSVADALRLAPEVAEALAVGGLRAARRVVWSPQARAVHRLRRVGLEALLRMPPEAVPAFFETFFALPERHRRAYLSGRDDLGAMLAAMGALFVRADGRLRGRLLGPAFRPPAPAVLDSEPIRL